MIKKAKPPILTDLTEFSKHPWIVDALVAYRRQAKLAKYAIGRLQSDLKSLNARYFEDEKKMLLTAVDGRVKDERSFTKKLLGKTKSAAKKSGLTQQTVAQASSDIRDIAGVRIAFPYFDQVLDGIHGRVRPFLADLGYGTDLSDDDKTKDKDYLDAGDPWGYRSYHFFVQVPTPVDIYDNFAPCLTEIQARTELQHVWAVKSHNILYKPGDGWLPGDKHVREDMRQVSNSLRAADQFLVSVRDRIRESGAGSKE